MGHGSGENGPPCRENSLYKGLRVKKAQPIGDIWKVVYTGRSSGLYSEENGLGQGFQSGLYRPLVPRMCMVCGC